MAGSKGPDAAVRWKAGKEFVGGVWEVTMLVTFWMQRVVNVCNRGEIDPDDIFSCP